MPVGVPSSNPGLPFRAGGFASLAEGLDYAARGETGFCFFGPRGTLETALSYAELRERALDLAARLGSLGLGRGERVALVAETDPDFVSLFFACQYAGLVPVPLPLPINFAGHAPYVARLAAVLRTARARAAFGSPELVPLLRQAAASTRPAFVGTVAELEALPAEGPIAPLGGEEACYVQFSSGSTQRAQGRPGHAAGADGQHRTRSPSTAAWRSGPATAAVSWLPLYHDMGLVGCCLTPALVQGSVDFCRQHELRAPPAALAQADRREQGGTISFSPTFGYELCARRAPPRTSPASTCGRWRVAGIGGEMIRPAVARGLRRDASRAPASTGSAFLPSYGLAEATLAVTFAPLGTGVRAGHGGARRRVRPHGRWRLAVPTSSTATSSATRSFVVCGRPLPGHEVEIRDEHGRKRPERCVGRICVQRPEPDAGYFGSDEATPARADRRRLARHRRPRLPGRRRSWSSPGAART